MSQVLPKHLRRTPMNRYSTWLPLIAFLLALGLAPGCGSDDDNGFVAPPEVPAPDEGSSGEPSIQTFEVRAYKETCLSEGPALCFIASQEGQRPRLISAPIENFNWQPGTNYVIEVEVRDIKNPPADGSSQTYRLVRVISESAAPVGSTFEIDIGPRWVEPSMACTFSLLEQLGFSTRNQELCDQLNATLSANRDVDARFSYTGQPNLPFLLETLKGEDIPTPTWDEVFYQERDINPVNDTCGKPTKFTVQEDGRFELVNCDDLQRGELENQDLAAVTKIADSLTEMNLQTPPVCQPAVTVDQEAIVDLTLSNGERPRVYRIAETGGECTRGDRAQAIALKDLMNELSERYAEDAPEPTPTPTATPTPTPTPEPPPTATPIPLPGPDEPPAPEEPGEGDTPFEN